MSIDVDLALDSQKLTDGRYADLLNLLLDTRRYERSEEPFQFFTIVDLADGQAPIRVDIDFLAPTEFKLRSTRTKKIEGFRVQQADGCGAAFRAPETITIEGRMTQGAHIEVNLRVAALPDFLVMKCYALHGRDKPKDAYVRAFVAGDNVAEARKLLEAELNTIREGEREYDHRHRRGDVHLRRVDHVLDAIELLVLPADPHAAFELLTRVIEADGQVAESAGDAWIQPTFDRACDLWFAAAKAVPTAEAEKTLARLTASDDYGLRDRLSNPAGDATTTG